MKHTDNYYINKIKKIFTTLNIGGDYQSFHSWCTPTSRGVYIEFNGTRVFESTSREKMLNDLKVLFANELKTGAK